MDFLEFAIATAEKAGKKLMQHFGESPPITRGTAKEVKSLLDETADEIIKGEIERCFPEHSYLTEESGMIDKQSDYLWIIDPVDGTGNYVNHNPFFAISIALWKAGEPLVAVIEAPALQERYTAEQGKGAFLSNTLTREQKPAQVSETNDISKAYLTFCEGGTPDRNTVVATIQKYYPLVKDMRKLGSAALECAWVGCGRADAYISHDISLWDIAAGVLFVSEAGGKILKFDGSEWNWKELSQQEDLNIIVNNQQLPLPLPL